MLQRDILRGRPIHEDWCKEAPHNPCNGDLFVDSKFRRDWCTPMQEHLRGAPPGNCQGGEILNRACGSPQYYEKQSVLQNPWRRAEQSPIDLKSQWKSL